MADSNSPLPQQSQFVRAPRRHSEVAALAEAPPRGSREAVLHLARLIKSRPGFRGDELTSRLIHLAERLNIRLEPELRLSQAEFDGAIAFDADPELVGQLAVSTIGFYVMNPAIEDELRKRQLAYLALERYVVWCRGLWLAVEASRPRVDSFHFDPEGMSPQDDIGEHALGAMLHWLASLCVVIEGWEELSLTDTRVDALLSEGGDSKREGSLRHRLNRFRNGVFHFQAIGTDDARFKEFWEDDVIRWAVPLERAFEAFFRDVWQSQQQTLEAWLFRNLERWDPELR